MTNKWHVTNDSECVHVVGRFSTQQGVEQVIRALEAQKPLLPASAIEAGTAETEGLGPEDESAVPNGETPISPSA